MFLNLQQGEVSGPIPIKVGNKVIIVQWYNAGTDMLEQVLRLLRLPLISGGAEFNAHDDLIKGNPIVFELKPINRFLGKPLEAVIPLIFHTAGREFGEPLVELVVKSPVNINIEELLV